MIKKYKFLVLFAGIILLAPWAAQAKRRARNPRRAKKTESARVPAVPQSQDKTSLALGRWDPQVKAALEKLALEHGKNSGTYDAAAPPIAVLPWDDAFMVNDLGEAVFQRLVRSAEFKFDDEFWEIVPIAYGRRRTRAAYEQFSIQPPEAWGKQPTYNQYRKYFLGGYKKMCGKVGRKECRSYLTKLLKGLSEEDVGALTKEVIKEESGRSLGQELVFESPEDAEAVWVSRGLRVIPEMSDLAHLLLDAGFDVWIAGLEAQPVLEAAISYYGLAPAHAAGISQSPLRGKLSGKILEPIPIRGGKTEAIIAKTGREPLLVVGGSSEDADLMSYGTGMRVMLDRGDKDLLDAAQRKGWLIQPSFVPE